MVAPPLYITNVHDQFNTEQLFWFSVSIKLAEDSRLQYNIYTIQAFSS